MAAFSNDQNALTVRSPTSTSLTSTRRRPRLSKPGVEKLLPPSDLPQPLRVGFPPLNVHCEPDDGDREEYDGRPENAAHREGAERERPVDHGAGVLLHSNHSTPDRARWPNLGQLQEAP